VSVGGRMHHRLLAWLPPYVPVTVVLMIAVLGFLRVLAQHWREGTGLLGGALLVAGVARVLLPSDRVGLLAVRSQVIDVLCYFGFGVLIVVLAVTVPRTPFILQQ